MPRNAAGGFDHCLAPPSHELRFVALTKAASTIARIDARMHDVLVIGSGASGLTTALVAAREGLDVLLVEKTRWFGGTSAYSGGGVWTPANHAMLDAGVSDSLADAERYLRALMGADYNEPLTSAFLRTGPEALDYLAKYAALQLIPSGGPDYEPHLPGAAAWRTLLSPDFDGRVLGPLLKQLRPALPQLGAPLGMQVSFTDMHPLTNAHRSLAALRITLRLFGRHLVDLLRFGRASRLTNGNALTARLLKGAADAGVTLCSEAPVVELLSNGEGVNGAVVVHMGQRISITARRGVVLATGGFGANEAMRREYIPLADAGWSLQPEGSEGDGIKLATGAGGTLGTNSVANGIWSPMSAIPRKTGRLAPFPHLMLDRLMPGSIVVDACGRRFVNEATHYQAFVDAMHRQGVRNAFLIGDARHLRRYGMGLARPGPWPIGRLRRAGYLKRANSIAELAGMLGIEGGALNRTIAEFNEHAALGEDPAFGRGTGAYARFMGDQTHLPNANLAPLENAPFYALELRPGMLSTSLGVETDASARVLDRNSRPIAGLFAVGVDMNSLWGGRYPAGGASLAAALTFGYIVGRTLAAGR
jgi:succinate dehydrogenase/fumarate reductase flavoprotein subunit